MGKKESKFLFSFLFYIAVHISNESSVKIFLKWFINNYSKYTHYMIQLSITKRPKCKNSP